MKTIDDISFSGKRALVRVDFNVPLDTEYHITDDTRIKAAIPTIEKILRDGGSVVLMSHLGRPKEGPVDKYSLKHLVNHLSSLLGKEVKFAGDCIGEDAFYLSENLKAGEVLLLENLRFYKEEEKGDYRFAEQLSKHGDIYVNDAFGTAHRAHASTAVIATFFPNAKMFGYLMAQEVRNIDRVVHNAQKPFTAILGGAKVSDKILILEQLLRKADNIIIGGGMAFTFIKAQGGQVGNSLIENDRIDTAKNILSTASFVNVNIHLPVDAVCAKEFSNDTETKIFEINNIPDGWMGLDIGPQTQKNYDEVISYSRTVLWNGPMGVFEMSNFEEGTKHVANSIARATKEGSFSLVGGGDSVAAINKYNLAKNVSYVSTGGGALLEYIESGSLPGVDAIMK